MLTTIIGSVSSADPVIPVPWVLLQVAVSLVCLALLIASLISIARTRNQPPARTTVWVAIVFLLPTIGPILWFIGGRKASRLTRNPGRTAGTRTSSSATR
ncbi:PLD nuclease N-terminal domain-containing protein [Arthrobacter sp. GMC3]|uniref:PLD nuclease N-terminal domain-containing protein n=1 Tax=Arthrobacter sp. GMC3 TaxID=2058894 RepID=UPI000CE510DA